MSVKLHVRLCCSCFFLRNATQTMHMAWYCPEWCQQPIGMLHDIKWCKETMAKLQPLPHANMMTKFDCRISMVLSSSNCF